jgi:hypothetical protein
VNTSILRTPKSEPQTQTHDREAGKTVLETQP